MIATYLSFDAGATWRNGGLLPPPAGKPAAGDDVTVAFDPHGRGYVCATATGSSDADRTMYAWRTDDGGRSFSAPVTLVTGGQYFDQPWIAAGAGQTPSERNVYVVWASNARTRAATAWRWPAPPTADESFEPAAHDPERPPPDDAERDSEDRRRSTRPGVRRRRRAIPLGLLRRPGRPRRGRLLDRRGTQLRCTRSNSAGSRSTSACPVASSPTRA